MSPPNVDAPNEDLTYHLPNEEEKKIVSEIEEEDEDKQESDPLNEAPDEGEVVVPPDGGWGWVIVAASFMCNMIVDGIIFSFGSFLTSISDELAVSKAKVTLVGSLMSGFYLIAGPFASALANRYGFRLVAILGAFIGALAFVISYFATSIPFLCISYGVLGGIGFGFIYVPSVITLGFYFERWRALATGIAVCGSGIGTFLFAPMTSMLIDALGWRDTLLVHGAIVLSCIIYGALFRPLKPTKLKDIDKAEELQMDPGKLPAAAKLKMEEALKNMKRNSLGAIHDHQTSIGRMLGVNNNSNYPRVSDVYHTISIPSQKMLEYEKRLSIPFIQDKDKLKKHLLEVKGPNPVIIKRNRAVSESQDQNEADVNRPMYREDIFFGASLTRLPQYTSRTSIAYNLAVTRVPTKNDIEEEKKRSCKLCPEAVRRTLATMLDYSLLKSPSFLFLAFSGFFTMMGFYVPFMYLVDRGKTELPESTTKWLIASIGVANTIGRVICGIISSFPGADALVITNIAMTVGGIATIFSGISMTAEYQFFYTVMFGLAISCFASLRSIIVVDLMGLEKLTNAFGLLLLFQGIAAIIGAPLAGAFMEFTGSYDASFYLSGGMLLLSAVMCYPLNWINRWETSREAQSVPV